MLRSSIQVALVFALTTFSTFAFAEIRRPSRPIVDERGLTDIEALHFMVEDADGVPTPTPPAKKFRLFGLPELTLGGSYDSGASVGGTELDIAVPIKLTGNHRLSLLLVGTGEGFGSGTSTYGGVIQAKYAPGWGNTRRGDGNEVSGFEWAIVPTYGYAGGSRVQMQARAEYANNFAKLVGWKAGVRAAPQWTAAGSGYSFGGLFGLWRTWGAAHELDLSVEYKGSAVTYGASVAHELDLEVDYALTGHWSFGVTAGRTISVPGTIAGLLVVYQF